VFGMKKSVSGSGTKIFAIRCSRTVKKRRVVSFCQDKFTHTSIYIETLPVKLKEVKHFCESVCVSATERDQYDTWKDINKTSSQRRKKEDKTAKNIFFQSFDLDVI